MSDARGRRLDSWKQIATYLGRDIRTIQRWETREQLPDEIPGTDTRSRHHDVVGVREREEQVVPPHQHGARRRSLDALGRNARRERSELVVDRDRRAT